MPSLLAVCAALCRLVAISDVTFWYSVGFDCCNCCNVLNICANGESCPLSAAWDEVALTLLEVEFGETPADWSAESKIDRR